jgi:demethylmenaquinone methyltransferase/2-methoxy-6-polyprenyl-1,4-benzoquinol methylase
MTESNNETTHFGFETVAEHAKAGLVKGVFDSVAGRYDLMNDLMSGGLHRLWKDAFVDWLRPRPDRAVLDVGGGTGDIAFRILKQGGGPVTVCDINAEMLAVGRDRALDRGLAGRIDWVEGDAEALPFEDRRFDAVVTAFCIRNTTHPETVLAEARRVLKPGGRFLCLEFSSVPSPILAKLYDVYSFKVLPEIGARVAGDRDAYRYLAESIRRFPDANTFAGMVAAAGLRPCTVRTMTGGVVAMHSAWRV